MKERIGKVEPYAGGEIRAVRIRSFLGGRKSVPAVGKDMRFVSDSRFFQRDRVLNRCVGINCVIRGGRPDKARRIEFGNAFFKRQCLNARIGNIFDSGKIYKRTRVSGRHNHRITENRRVRLCVEFFTVRLRHGQIMPEICEVCDEVSPAENPTTKIRFGLTLNFSAFDLT